MDNTFNDRRQKFRRITDLVNTHQFESLLEASKLMNATLDLDQLLELIMTLATQNLNADRSTLYLVDHEREEIWSKVLKGEEWLHIRLPLGQGIAGHVAQTGERINITDAYEDTRFYKEVDEKTGFITKTVLCLPMHNRDGQIVGVIQVLNSKDSVFTVHDEQFLEAIASHAAVSIERALLHSEALERRRLEHELVIAREIQQGLLPPIDIQVDSFNIAALNQCCLEVGGDYYDIFQLDDSLVAFAIGDVSGKGVPAALLMSATSAAMRIQVRDDCSPQRIIKNINQLLYDSAPNNSFVTLFYGVLNLRTGEISYVNAGHESPVGSNHEGICSILDTGGMILGVLEDAPYDIGSVTLAPGQTLVLFTDGVTEALNDQQQEFGRDRLHNLLVEHTQLPSSEIIALVQEKVTEFSESQPQHDDLTMMVIKRH